MLADILVYYCQSFSLEFLCLILIEFIEIVKVQFIKLQWINHFKTNATSLLVKKGQFLSDLSISFAQSKEHLSITESNFWILHKSTTWHDFWGTVIKLHQKVSSLLLFGKLIDLKTKLNRLGFWGLQISWAQWN